jgi:predicted ATPase/class 3 adenylate cyclase
VGVRPSGTVTFLFTDIEGSTRRWEDDADEMRAALALHDDIVRSAVERHDGFVFATGGDGFAVAFARAGDALTCASAAQRELQAAGLPPVRIGIHSGEAEERDGDYFGPAVNRTARIMAIGHGGQTLVSGAAHALTSGFDLLDLGEHRLRDLSQPERVFQLVVPDLPAEFPPLRSLERFESNLPVQLTTFVGREDDVKSVVTLLTEQRMVTLTGVGGVGKTRLALQVGAELLDRFRDGVWLSELAAVEESRLFDAIAAALDVELAPTRNAQEAVLDALHDRELLLIVDNCEHVLREARRVIGGILRDARRVSVLATSREGLRVDGERLVPVASLDDDAAAQLFVERAVAADASFSVSDAERPIVERICARLDGMPLAIELVAARARMFSLDELARRVEQRFRLLTGGRGGVERHQTLRAAIDWSYDLLEPQARLVFTRLAVFAGGWTIDAAEEVVADEDDVERDLVLDVLADLVDKSLVQVDRSRAETRYSMLETIRQYAEARLVETGEADMIRARHAAWAGTFARAAGRGLYSADEVMWLERLRAETDNLQIAAVWAVATGEGKWRCASEARSLVRPSSDRCSAPPRSPSRRLLLPVSQSTPRGRVCSPRLRGPRSRVVSTLRHAHGSMLRWRNSMPALVTRPTRTPAC